MNRAACLIVATAWFASPASATEVGFGASAGIRSVETGLMLGNTNFQEARGADANVNVYVSPGKLPVAVSASVDHQSYELNKSIQYFDHMEVTEADLALAFLPQGAKARPLVRLGYTCYGNAIATTSGNSDGTLSGVPVAQGGESVWKMSVGGTHFTIGTQLEAGKGALLTLGLDFGQTEAKIKNVSIGGADATAAIKNAGLDHFRMKSSAVLIGGEIAL